MMTHWKRTLTWMVVLFGAGAMVRLLSYTLSIRFSSLPVTRPQVRLAFQMTAAAKRMMDVTLALVGLVVAAPLLGVISAIIAVTMGRPILFRQERPGLHGKPFLMLKFRTMRDTRDANGELLPDEQRLTAMGRFLRSTSLDELPELINVLRGEMSLVGPRPLLMRYLERYTPEQARRHEVKPGITGWAQINGRNGIPWEEKFALDLEYVDNLSLWKDLQIIVLTVWKIVRREGISEPGQATMTEFLGNRAEYRLSSRKRAA